MGVYLDWASKPWTFNGSFTVLILNFTQHLGGLKMSEALQENNTFKQAYGRFLKFLTPYLST